jgi:hypothetical protein
MIRDLFNPHRRSSLAAIGLVIIASLTTVATASAAPQQNSAGAGVPCIAMFMPTVSGVSGSAEAIANGVRDMFAAYLSAPAFKAGRGNQ